MERSLLKILKLLIIIFIAFFLFSSPARAKSIYLEENFDDGSADGWVESAEKGSWSIVNGEYIGTVTLSYPEKPTYSYFPSIPNNNYIFEADVKSTSGVDKSVMFRFNSIRETYTINLRSKFGPGNGEGNDINLVKVTPTEVKILKRKNYENHENEWYRLKIFVEDNHFKVFVGNDPLIDFIDNNNPILLGTVGLQVWPGSYTIPAIGSVTTLHYDNIVVRSLPEKNPIILLPGIVASWNYETIVLGQERPQREWIMTPGARMYDGLIQTLKNAGYTTEGENKNLFVFNYNWTKKVDSMAEDLRNYIEAVVDPPEGTKIDLVGHSLGGLVARTYVQNNPDHPIDQLVTVGSPLKGAPHIYYAWSGGDLPQALAGWPGYQRALLTLLVHLRREKFATIAATLHKSAPGLEDLLPTFNYLKQNGEVKPVEAMIQRNDWLINLNSALPPSFLLKLNTIVGILPSSTVRWIHVEEPNWLEKILNLWPDGKPTGERELAPGDNTVLVESAQLAGAHVFNLTDVEHTDLVRTAAGQEKIMEILNLWPTEIVPAPKFFWESSLVFILASPVSLLVLDPGGQPVGETEGQITFIPEATPGEYQLQLIGTGSGPYQLHIGQIAGDKNIWTALSGEINPGEEDLYQINFNPASPLENPLVDPNGDDHLGNAKSKLLGLKNYLHQETPACERVLLSHLNHPIRLLDQSKIEKSIVSLYHLRYRINACQLAGKMSDEQARYLKNKILEIIKDLEHAYIIIETNHGGQYSPKKLNQELKITERYFERMEERLKALESQGKANPDDGALYLAAQEKLEKAQSSSSYEAHINALGARYLSLEGLLLFRFP